MTQKEKSPYYYKLFRVKKTDGKVSTVSVDPVLVAKACQVLGGLDEVARLVRVAASTYEQGSYKNCSAYVSDKLKSQVMEALAIKKSVSASADQSV